MSAWTDEEVTAIVNGLFEINAKLADALEELVTIRQLLEEDDGRGDEEEG